MHIKKATLFFPLNCWYSWYSVRSDGMQRWHNRTYTFSHCSFCFFFLNILFSKECQEEEEEEREKQCKQEASLFLLLFLFWMQQRRSANMPTMPPLFSFLFIRRRRSLSTCFPSNAQSRISSSRNITTKGALQTHNYYHHLPLATIGASSQSL